MGTRPFCQAIELVQGFRIGQAYHVDALLLQLGEFPCACPATDRPGGSPVIVNFPGFSAKALPDIFATGDDTIHDSLQHRQRPLGRNAGRPFRHGLPGRTGDEMSCGRQPPDIDGAALRTETSPLACCWPKSSAERNQPSKRCSSRQERSKMIMTHHWLVPGTGIEPVRLAARDFKSPVFTNFTIRAKDGGLYARFQMQRGKAHRYAFPCMLGAAEESRTRPQPWQGCALPTELLPR